MLSEKVLQEIGKVLRGLSVYLVGGCVRDLLLNQTPHDFDFVVVGASPEVMQDRGFSVHGIEHSVFIHRGNPTLNGMEFSLARREKRVGEGHKGFTFEFSQVTLEEDLYRRDFTVNAMAIPVGGSVEDLIDPFGGRTHLRQGILRHVSEAFAEDPLRVLRLARFAARFDWVPAEETLTLCRDLVKRGDLRSLTPERVGMELVKALSTKHPQNFLRVLRDCRALEEVLPELNLYGIPQPADHHPEVDTGTHVELCLQQGVKILERDLGFVDPVVMWGILVHDVGKKLTPQQDYPQHTDHDKLGVSVAQSLARRLKLSNSYVDLGGLACELHMQLHRILEMRSGSIVKLLGKMDIRGMLESNVQGLAVVAEADATGRAGRSDRACPEVIFFKRAAEVFKSVSPRAGLVEQIQQVSSLEKKAFGDKIRACQVQDRAEAISRMRSEGK